MKRPEHIFIRMWLLLATLLTAMAPAMAQLTVPSGQASPLSVVPIPGDTYSWEIYSTVSNIDLANTPGNCPPDSAYFVGNSDGPSVLVMWLHPGTYYYKVTANRDSCSMNLKVGMVEVTENIPTAEIEPPPPVCEGTPVTLTVDLTGSPPWSITLTDSINSFVFTDIMMTPYLLTVPVTPQGTTSYWITQVSNINGTNNNPSGHVVQVINPKPTNSRIYKYKK